VFSAGLTTGGRGSGWTFLERVEGRDDPYRDAERVLAALGTLRGHVVAQSYGAVAALLTEHRQHDDR
jgi:pimeloyl-ACP methyl ester carboxylesterase